MEIPKHTDSTQDAEVDKTGTANLSQQAQNILKEKPLLNTADNSTENFLPPIIINFSPESTQNDIKTKLTHPADKSFKADPNERNTDPGMILKPDPSLKDIDPGMILKPDPSLRDIDPGMLLKPDPNLRNIDPGMLLKPEPNLKDIDPGIILDPDPDMRKIDFAEYIGEKNSDTAGKKPTKTTETIGSITNHYEGRDDGLTTQRIFKSKNGHSDSRMNHAREQKIYENGKQEITDIRGKTKIITPKEPEQPQEVRTFQDRKDGLLKQEVTREWTISSFKNREDGLKQQYEKKADLQKPNSIAQVLKYEDGKEVYTYGDGKIKVHEAPKSRRKK